MYNMWQDLWNNPTRTDILIMAWHESHTLALSRHTNQRTTNSQVCFHWHHFCDPVNSWKSTMECAVPLGIIIRLHLVSNCCWWPYQPDKWTVAVCALQWIHNGCFSCQICKGICLRLSFRTPNPYKLNPWYWRGLGESVWKSSCIS